MANTAIIDLAKPAGTDHALISVINSNMDKIDAEAGRQRGNFAGTYSTTSGYAVGDYCIYQGNLYRCTTAIGSSGENWTAGHWTLVKVGTELKGLFDQMVNNNVTFTISSSHSSATNSLKAVKNHKTVSIYGAISNLGALTAGSYSTLGTISNAPLPYVELRSTCVVANASYENGDICYLSISPQGEINILPRTSGSGKAVYFTVTYIGA